MHKRKFVVLHCEVELFGELIGNNCILLTLSNDKQTILENWNKSKEIKESLLAIDPDGTEMYKFENVKCTHVQTLQTYLTYSSVKWFKNA